MLIIGIVLLLGVIGYLVVFQPKTGNVARNTQTPIETSQPSATTAPIQNSDDLNTVSASLDSTDSTQLDAELNKLESETSSF